MERKTQVEQIRAAKRAYILPLLIPDDAIRTARYQVYLLVSDPDQKLGLQERLEVLWPSDSHLGKNSKELLPNQVYGKRPNYPAFHFALDGCGFSKTYEIRQALEAVNPELVVEVLQGHSPSNA